MRERERERGRLRLLALYLFCISTLLFGCPEGIEGEIGSPEIKPTSISVFSHETEVSTGLKVLMTATVLPADADQTVSWTSSDISTATVDEFGTVIGLKPGIVTITATSAVDSNVKGTYELTIEPPLLNLEWKISDGNISVVLKDLLSTLEELQPSVMPAKVTASVNGVEALVKDTISNEHTISLGDFEDSSELTVNLTFYDENDNDITSSVNEYPVIFSLVVNKKTGTVTPAHINILRKTKTDGTPVATMIAALSYPDVTVLMNELAGEDVILNTEQTVWMATLTGAANEIEISGGYGDIFETELDLNADYDFTAAVRILTPDLTGMNVVLADLTWGNDKLFGDKITVKSSREYPAEIWLDNEGNYSETEVAGYTKYVLSWGDDFNYPFNGLNYKNNKDYLAARENSKDPAFNFARLWGCENLEKGSHGRKSGTWDFRTIEAKNGMLMSKHMAANADNGIFYLGLNKTKPLGGFTDINQDGQPPHTFVPNFISGAAVTNELYGKGYYVAKLRTRYKGYSDTKHFTGGDAAGGSGAWFAFWMHGPVHEFDLMEQTAGSPLVINYVNQYHNGWGTYGTTYMSYFYQQLNVNGADTVMQDNWYKLALQWTDDQVTYYYNDVWAHYYRATNNNKQASLTKNGNLRNQTGAVSNDGNPNRPSVNTSGFTTSYTDHGYNADTLLAVPQAPMNVFLSTEIGNGWGSVPTQENALNHLPVWVEADYIAYYVPESSSGASN